MLRVAQSRLFEREVKKFPWVAYCTEPNCYFTVSAKDEEQGQKSLDIHKCPYGGSAERMPTGNLIAAMWRELDACMDGIMLAKTEPSMADKVEHYRSRAGGIATCLYILLGNNMNPTPWYYATQDDITREAVRRYKMRIGEMEWEPTQGDNYDALRDGPTPRWQSTVDFLRGKGMEANSRINPPPNRAPVAPRQPRKPRRTTAPTSTATLPTVVRADIPGVGLPGVPSPRKLPDDVVTGIKNALAAEMDVSVIASVFQVSVSDVESLRG